MIGKPNKCFGENIQNQMRLDSVFSASAYILVIVYILIYPFPLQWKRKYGVKDLSTERNRMCLVEMVKCIPKTKRETKKRTRAHTKFKINICPSSYVLNERHIEHLQIQKRTRCRVGSADRLCTRIHMDCGYT